MSVLPQRVSAWRAPALLLLRTAVLARPSRSACRVGAQFVLVDLGPHTDTLHKVGGAGAAALPAGCSATPSCRMPRNSSLPFPTALPGHHHQLRRHPASGQRLPLLGLLNFQHAVR